MNLSEGSRHTRLRWDFFKFPGQLDSASQCSAIPFAQNAALGLGVGTSYASKFEWIVEKVGGVCRE